MTESVVFFSKHDISNVLADHLVNVLSHLKCTILRKCFIQISHLGLHILYNHFCVLSFHSVLFFPNDYHMVKVLDLFVQGVSAQGVYVRGVYVLGVYVLGVSVQGVSVQGVSVQEGIYLGGSVHWGWGYVLEPVCSPCTRVHRGFGPGLSFYSLKTSTIRCTFTQFIILIYNEA